MKSGHIFLLGNDQQTLTAMEETPYASEDILQVLLAQYPDLIC